MFVILYIMIAGTVDSFVEGLGITLCCCCFDHRHGVAVLGVLTTVLASVRFGIATGMGLSMLPRFCEYKVKQLRFSACCRQENATFSPHIHGT